MRADTVIIGGGAAGLFAACELSRCRKNVIVLEPNAKLGRKLRITGKGRCNVTNNCDIETVLKNIPKNPRFLYSALNLLSPTDVIYWFEEHGVPLKTERGNRVFPVSDKADDIADAMVLQCKKFHVKFIKDKACELILDDGVLIGVKGESDEYFAQNVIIATGGKSYPKTGSTGDGYRLAESVGHSVTQIKPSLVPIVTHERFVCELTDLTLKNVTLSLYDSKKKSPLFSEIGELSFMPYGVAGPLSLSASCLIKTDALSDRRYTLVIDLKPGLTLEQLDARILRDFGEAPTLAFMDSLGKLLPRSLIPVIVDLSKIPPLKPVNQVTREERSALVNLLKNLKLTPTDLRPIDEAIITSGGINVKEINPATMESKIIDGLYFAGEIIDCDGYTGGFNLQIAFSTAYCAAKAICGEW
ncbi:MAG: NAD(P)/FAD-dependent oxidoreductase [Oscillospiraceae bacterium]|nr:NAD(P)/FAD-dependent oxidoreductase [Oscillospiraceae bacterium]